MTPATLPPRRLRRRYTRTRQFRKVFQLYERQQQLSDIEAAGIEHRLLPQPVFMGWERYFVVRQDLRRSPDSPYLERLLNLLQNVEPCDQRGVRKQRDWRRGGKLRVVKHQLKHIDAGTYWAMTSKMQRYFDLHVFKRRNHWTRRTELETVFVLRSPWKFTTRVREHWKTHEKVYTVNVDSEEAVIQHHLYGPSEYLFRHWARHEGDYNKYDYGTVPPADLRRAPLVEELGR